MREDVTVDAIAVLTEHSDDPCGTGLQALAEALVRAGAKGVELRDGSGTRSHLAGEIDPDDVAELDVGPAVARCSPRPAIELIRPHADLVATAFLMNDSVVMEMVRTTPRPTAVRRGDGTIISTNQAWRDLTGVGTGVGDAITAGIHPDDQGRAEDALRRLRTEGGMLHLDVRYVRADGSTVLVRVHATSTLWPSGQVRSIVTRNEDLTERIRLEEQLAEREMLSAALRRCPFPLHLRDADLRLSWANEAFEQLTERTIEELLGTLPADLVEEDGTPRTTDDDEVDHIRRIPLPGNRVRRVRIRSAKVDLDEGESRFVVFSEDLTERLAAEAELGRLRRRLETMLEHAPGQITLYDADLRVAFSTDEKWNDLDLAQLARTGLVTADDVGRIRRLLEDGEPQRWYTWSVDEIPRWVEVSAAPVLDDTGRPEGVVSISIDRTEQYAAERQLAHQATHDDLTGLLDRAGLMQGLAAISASGDDYALLFVDLDNFKDVNDTLGHEVGDQLLRTVASRLRDTTGHHRLVGRAGGDEFVIASTGAPEEILRLTERLLAALRPPITLEGAILHVTASIGVAHVPGGTSTTEAMRQADVAMYEAKRRGRNRFATFDIGLEQRVAKRRSTEDGLRRALAADELTLHYQPEYDLATGRMLGAEALLRWNDPSRDRPVTAGEFIEIAETTGLIGDIGRFVIRRAAADAADWPTDLTVRVNVSARQLEQPDLVEMIVGELRRAGLPPGRLCVELTETALATPESLGTIHELSAAGIPIALDDFGTGFSSLSLLRTLPVDVIKIDRSFVDGLGTESDDTALVRSIVGLAESLGHDVVAEGVETALHVQELVALGCRRAQGFGLDRPMPIEQLRHRFGGGPPELLGRRPERHRFPVHDRSTS